MIRSELPARAEARAGIHFPGFDGIRLFAALSVVFSHAFLIATGSEATEPLARVLGPMNILGLYGVYTFFIISGFLLAHSLARDPSPVRFSVNRVLRIFPGYVLCILATALVMGPIVSPLSLLEYLRDPNLLNFLAATLSCLCDKATLPGVYGYQAPGLLSTTVNGSLWSLSFEVLSYVLLLWLWLLLRDMSVVGIALALLAAATIAFRGAFELLPGVTFTLPYFAGGVLMYAVQQRVGLKLSVAAACVVALVVAGFFGLQRTAYALFGAYVIVFLGSRPNIGSVFAARAGDLSYGVYLFGWPVEQLVKRYTLTDSPWLLLAVAAPLTLMIAFASYRWVERPALRLRKPLSQFFDRLADAGAINHPAVRLAAKLAFLVTAAAILMSERHWWFVTEVVAVMAISSAIAGALAASTIAALRAARLRKSP